MIVRALDGGVEIRIRAQPRASRTEIVGPYGDRAVKLRLSAPPVDGAANAELVRFLADLFGVSRSDVVLVRGHGSRDKVVRIGGTSEKEARVRLGL